MTRPLNGPPAFMVFRVAGDPAIAESWLIDDGQLEDTIDEEDAPRFRTYAVAGDFYTCGDLMVVKLGRRFTPSDWKP